MTNPTCTLMPPALVLAALAIMMSCKPQQDVGTERARQAEIADLKKRISNLEDGWVGLNLKRDAAHPQSADLDVLTPSSYARVEADNGTILYLFLRDVQPFLNGYQLTLDIGNPTLATYNGFKVKAKWGTAYTLGGDYDSWERSLQEKEFAFTENLRPGVWNKVVLHLAPASKDQLGKLEISMAVDKVSLQN